MDICSGRLGPILVAIAALTFTGCDDGEDDTAGDAGTGAAGSDTGDDDDDDDDDTGADSESGGDSTRPAEVEAVISAIEDESYMQWEAEPAPHAPVGNSPHPGEVRTFFNEALAGSMGAGNTEHPVGSAAIKESWMDGELAGHFIEVKVAEGTGEESWYWWSDLAGVDDVGGSGTVSGCVGCHSAGIDYVTTAYPFE